jgi:micrococcal nuclease
VVDGDTVWVSRNGRRIKLRLIYIDAPEIKQLSLDGFAVGEWSKAFLDRALGEKISFINHGRDRYGRTLAELFWRGQNLNYELVAAGFSFVYKFAKFKSSTQKRRFIRAFYHAHSLNLGMWSTTGVMNPYNWRKIRQ